MLINLSNHPIACWSQSQLEEAKMLYADVMDMPFPTVPPQSDEAFIADLAQEYQEKCLSTLHQFPLQKNAIHVMGEMTLTFALVSLLLKDGVDCVASTTERIVTSIQGKDVPEFRFVRFRKYPRL